MTRGVGGPKVTWSNLESEYIDQWQCGPPAVALGHGPDSLDRFFLHFPLVPLPVHNNGLRRIAFRFLQCPMQTRCEHGPRAIRITPPAQPYHGSRLSPRFAGTRLAHLASPTHTSQCGLYGPTGLRWSELKIESRSNDPHLHGSVVLTVARD
jgi:hypothetical protein